MTTTPEIQTIMNLVKQWNENKDSHIPRNELRKLAKNKGLTLERYVVQYRLEAVTPISSPKSHSKDRPLQDFAQTIWEAGYRGEGLHSNAEVWIKMMAEGDSDEFDMPEAAHRFWKAVRTKYAYWRTANELNNNV
jgi:hypothetical protein